MRDLNDLLFFAKVAEHGGFNAASRVLGIPKSRLSRRVAGLEQQLGVRLLQRTTRKLALTEVGASFYGHCQAMLAEAEAAEESISHITAEARGLIRVSCPELLAKTLLGPLLPRFMQRHPQVRLQLESTNRRVNLIEEGIDVALRIRSVIEDSASLVVHRIGNSPLLMVASPALLEQYGTPASPAELARLPALSMNWPDGRCHFALLDAVGHDYSVQIEQPRLITDDLMVQTEAAEAGLGVAVLPARLCQSALADGRLVRLLPDYDIPGGILHAVFPSRRGLVPAVRAFIDFLATELVLPGYPGYERLN